MEASITRGQQTGRALELSWELRTFILASLQHPHHQYVFNYSILSIFRFLNEVTTGIFLNQLLFKNSCHWQETNAMFSLIDETAIYCLCDFNLLNNPVKY